MFKNYIFKSFKRAEKKHLYKTKELRVDFQMSKNIYKLDLYMIFFVTFFSQKNIRKKTI